MTTPGREIELKFLLDRPAADAVLAAFTTGDISVKDMVAVYFDTADHWLRRSGFGLRVRRSGKGRIQTLKSALGEDGGRDEWEWPVETDSPDASLLSTTPAALPSGAVLVPLFEVRSRRTTRMIDKASARIELVVDDATVSAGDRTEAFLELEIELKTGDAATLATLAEQLGRLAPLTPSTVTKAERGFRLLAEQSSKT
jgi:triphosphatase